MAEATYHYRPGARLRLSRQHKLSAATALESKRQIPCSYMTAKIDVTKLLTASNKMNYGTKDKISPTVSVIDFIIRAVAVAVKQYPVMADREHTDFADGVCVGLITETDDRLVGMVMEKADGKGIAQIAAERRLYVKSAAKQQFCPAAPAEACTTVCQLDSTSVELYIPIVIPGQHCIIGAGRITKRCAVIDGNIAAVDFLTLSMAFDHRIINSSEAAEFLDFIKKMLENTSGLI